MRILAILAAAATFCGVACNEEPEAARQERPRPPWCPASRTVDPPLANVEAKHETVDYWLSRNELYGPLDEPLLSGQEVRRHNLALAAPTGGEPLGQADLVAPVDRRALQSQVERRLAHLREKLEAGELVDSTGKRLDAALLSKFELPEPMHPMEEWRIVEQPMALRCGPFEEGLYRTPVDLDFDRNRCSTMRPGEVVQLLARWPNGMHLARTPYALGWIGSGALSSPLERRALEARLGRREIQPLTRRAVLTEALSMVGEPYGWGGKDGGYDCSQFVLDLFARFGIDLPRHSSLQSLAGTFSIDVSGVEDLNEKRLLFDAAAHRGIVLLHFPGHIMLYLGATEEGAPMAIHAFSEFLTPCDGTGDETVNRVDEVVVSDLTLGAGSSRRDFLSRITRVTVLGRTPGPELSANAVLRRSAPVSLPRGRCAKSKGTAIFHSPRSPNPSQPLRIIATSEHDPELASLVLFAPDQTSVTLEQHVLDGPPHGRWVELPSPTSGEWTAVLADGDQIHECERIRVLDQAARPEPRAAPAPAWEPSRSWESDAENLYAAFVEQLFREPYAEEITWPGLQALIGERKRNLLYDHRFPGEDAQLDLQPDCADLPYFLRAYFAWKLRLPFVYRSCTRGRQDMEPRCDQEMLSNLDPVPGGDAVSAFRRFVRRLAGTVHSSSPRTLPEDDETDFYPLPLDRGAIRPGTVFADPYGHVLVVARWKPQGLTDYGVLIGADAQPDGTVGRRRFWRGTFLFTPKTDHVGAGFKGWRPVRHEPEAQPQPWRVATNDELRRAGESRAWSDAQYRGSADDFYAAMEGLINPRALDPVRMQVSLVDALEESVQRRLSSVGNGEEFMRVQGYEPIEMPRGAALFLTIGPWEDYSTPSRDMRLLISIDAVVSFPDTVAAHPDRFGVGEADVPEATRQVRDVLRSELEKRLFEYARSDGSPWTLSLAELVERAKRLETAYNPNDCVEIRWGATEGTEEHATCERRAPEEQRKRMQQYRQWFARRERPG